MSTRDLVLLANRIITDYPDFYTMFAEQRFEFDGRAPQNVSNRNPLLVLGIGADGLKTGHTQEAGYGLVGSAKQGDRRVIFAISGLDSQRARAEESEAIVNWAFRQFAEKTIVTGGHDVARADVWMGASKDVGLVSEQDVALLIPTLTGAPLEAEVVYTGPLRAPIVAGQKLAELIIRPEGLPDHRVPLVAAEDVPGAGFVDRVLTVAGVLVRRALSGGGAPAGTAPEPASETPSADAT